MTNHERLVVGIFTNRVQMRNTLVALKEAHFSDEQIGFVLRDERILTQPHMQTENHSHPILQGLVGGLMGVADALLVPITGPSDATNILATTLPIAEEAIDHLPQRHMQQEHQKHSRPDAPMTATHAETAAAPTPKPVPTEPEGEETEEETSTVTGEVVGGVLGAAIGILIPGIGPAIVVGSLASLFGIAFGGVAGGFLGTFIHLGVPEQQARKYEHAVKSGQIVVTVKADERTQVAEELLRHYGAQLVETH